jgi:drug/metabolite transporter (DMT)-like permease
MINKRNSGTLIAGAVLIAVGLLALFGQLFRGFQFWNYLWPFIIIAIGALFFVGMFVGGKPLAGLAVPGTIISGIGVMMFFQNLLNHWESWSYGWTVILFLVGLGIFIMGLYSGNLASRRSGLSLMKVGAILFVIFGAFFELIFSFGRPHGLQQYLFPAFLILLGGYLILSRSGLLGSRRSQSSGASGISDTLMTSDSSSTSGTSDTSDASSVSGTTDTSNTSQPSEIQ